LKKLCIMLTTIFAISAMLTGFNMSTNTLAAKKNITLTISRWAGPHADAQAELLKEFEKQTGITVKMDAIDYGQLYQKQVLNMSSKTGQYDLVWAQEIWLPKYVKSGYLKPMNSYFNDKSLAENKFNISNYTKSIIKINTFNGKLYGLPTYIQTPILVYNEEMLEKEGLKVPSTWAEVLKVAKYFKAKGTGIALPNKQGQAAVDVWAAIMRSNDGDYFNKNGKLDLAQTKNVEAATFWQELAAQSMQGSANWHYDEVNKALQFGTAPIGITASGLAAALEDPANSKVAGKIGYAPLPYSKHTYGTLAIWDWCVTADSKHPKEAFQLAAWLTSKETEKQMGLKTGQIAAVTSLNTDKDLVSKMPWLPAVGKALANSNTQPLDDNSPKLMDGMATALSELGVSKAAPKTVLQKLQKQLASQFK
jgi:multiple sugar transport system substrate-binding protein